jgi:large subunit ribosomal protein L23
MSAKFALKPRVSEKAYNMSQTSGVYVFEVPTEVNKTEIAEAVETVYSVSVTAVRVINQKGKSKRTYRKRQGWIDGKKSDIKKAYVTLKKGDEISIFPAEDEKKAKESKTAAKSKKATRSAK